MDIFIDVIPRIDHSIVMMLPLATLFICLVHDKLIRFFEIKRKRQENQAKMKANTSSPSKPSTPPPPTTTKSNKRKVSYNLRKGANRYTAYSPN